MYHKWQSHDVWFLRYGVQQTEFVFILDCFLLFYPPNNPKNQNFEKWKKRLEIPLFYTCVPQMTIIWCKVPEIWSVTYRIFSHFGLYFALLFSNNLEHQKFLKWKKTLGDKHFWYVYQKLWSHDVWFLRYGAGQMDSLTDGQKKWHIEVGATPKNKN